MNKENVMALIFWSQETLQASAKPVKILNENNCVYLNQYWSPWGYAYAIIKKDNDYLVETIVGEDLYLDHPYDNDNWYQNNTEIYYQNINHLIKEGHICLYSYICWLTSEYPNITIQELFNDINKTMDRYEKIQL